MQIRNKKNKLNKGYTIIETMIAVSLFLVVIMAGMGALLNANLLQQKSQDIRSIMDNLSFVMEEISRSARLGYNFHCMAGFSSSNIEVPQSCASGRALAFENSLGNKDSPLDQWVYKIELDPSGSGAYFIYKSIQSGAVNSWFQLNPSEVALTSASSFSVLGAESSLSGDSQQPFVMVRLVGSITSKGVVTPFSLQSSISQRLLDIPFIP